MIESTVTSKGQITIPKSIREELDLVEGTTVIFMQEGGRAIMMPKVKNPLKAMLELRKTMRFTEDEIREMIAESKKEWSKIG